MRNCLLSMISCAALVTACQQVTPISMKPASPRPNLKINYAAPQLSASMAPPVPEASPLPSVPAETLSSGTVDQNKNQTEIDLAISTITTSDDTPKNLTQESSNITPKAVALPKTFDPTKIIGFATPTLVQNLGKANMVRQEGSIEVWQYRFGSCVVDFFFYPIGDGASQLISKNWDMRSAIMGNLLDRGNCRNEMNLYHQKILSNS
jgi:hypothetical protein